MKASEHENADLLWGLRGGGSNFGIVTSFEYQLHAVGPTMFAGALVFSADDARDLLKFFTGFAAEAPDELNADAALASIPVAGSVLAFDICYCGRVEDGERLLGPLRRFRRHAA